MSKPRILVTAAAGKTGNATALQLLEKGYPVRAFVRRDDDRAERLRRAGAEVFVGNMADMQNLRDALKDVQRAYFCTPTAANALHYSTVSPSPPGRQASSTQSRWASGSRTNAIRP